MKTAIRYGVVVGLGSFVWLLAEYFLGFRTDRFDVHLKTAPFMVVILIAGIVAAIYVGKMNKGKSFRFGQGVLTGLVVSLVAGVIMVLGQYVYFGLIDQDYAKRAQAWSTYVQVLDGKTLEEAKQDTEDGKWKHNMHVRALGQIPQFLAEGLVISVVASLVLTRNAKTKS